MSLLTRVGVLLAVGQLFLGTMLGRQPDKSTLYLLRATPYQSEPFPIELRYYDASARTLGKDAVTRIERAILYQLHFDVAHQTAVLILTWDLPMDARKLELAQPTRLTRFELRPDVEGSVVLSALQRYPGRGLELGIEVLTAGKDRVEYWTAPADSFQPRSPTQGSFDVLRYQAEGYPVLPATLSRLRTQIEIGANGAMMHRTNGRLVAIPIETPSEFHAPASGFLYGEIPISNADLLCVGLGNDIRPASLSTRGARGLWIYKKASKNWSHLVVPGSASGFRLFGDRIATVVRDSVAEYLEQDADLFGEWENMKIRELYRQDSYRYPGLLLIDDWKTGQRWQIETGHTDSEVLLIEGDVVYYRIHEKLMRGRLDKGGSVTEREMLAAAPEIAEMHWAFFGPAVKGKQ